MRAPIENGEVLGDRYRVERVIGSGGTGVVVAATDTKEGRTVAVKLLGRDVKPETRRRFAREARAARRLQGEHVTRVLDVGETAEGVPYMVMEFLEGSDLSTLVKERGPLAVDFAVDLLLQACEAIAEAHHLGIVHRDIKPANLFLMTRPDGSAFVKVFDFGISKQVFGGSGEDSIASLTKTTDFLGSPLYTSPEQLRSANMVDARSDIWSLGVTLFQLLTGKLPFESATYTQLIMKVAHDMPNRPSEHRDDLPEELEAVILRCLEKEPSLRFGSVPELAAALEPFGPPGAKEMVERIAAWPPSEPLSARSSRSPVSVPPSIPPSSIPPRAPEAVAVSTAGETRRRVLEITLAGLLGAVVTLALSLLFLGRLRGC